MRESDWQQSHSESRWNSFTLHVGKEIPKLEVRKNTYTNSYCFEHLKIEPNKHLHMNNL